jgi:hypothetical protein
MVIINKKPYSQLEDTNFLKIHFEKELQLRENKIEQLKEKKRGF